MSAPAETQLRAGILYAIGAYTFWGIAPAYFILVDFAQPLEVLSHRVLWSLPLLAGLVTMARQWSTIKALSGRQYARLAVCAILLSCNWLIFIYAVQNGRIAETALGYYINPLVSIVLGRMVLGERMRPLQWLAAGIAVAAVGFELLSAGSVPLLALTLALTFGLYGLLRKQLAVPSSVGLSVEATMMAPLALAYLLFVVLPDAGIQRELQQVLLLGLGGAVTVTPLIWFASAAIRLPLFILGFIQYLAPSIALVLAVFVYGEAVSDTRWVSFALIWAALALLTVEALLFLRRGTAATLAD